MKRNFALFLYDLRGKPFEDENKAPLSLGRLSVDTLLTHAEGLSGTQKFERYKLCRRIEDGLRDGELVEITAEEISQIKEAVAARQPPMVVGPVWEALEQEPREPATKAAAPE